MKHNRCTACSIDKGTIPIPVNEQYNKLSNELDFPELVYVTLVKYGVIARGDHYKKLIREVIVNHYAKYEYLNTCKYLEMLCELEDTLDLEIPNELYQIIMQL